jgi:hypothetical protein
VDRKIGIGAKTGEVAAVLAPDVHNESARCGMSLAASNERSGNAQSPQILQNKLPEKIIADFAEHTRAAAQTPQISRSVGSTSSDTKHIAAEECQFAGAWKGSDGVPADVGN